MGRCASAQHRAVPGLNDRVGMEPKSCCHCRQVEVDIGGVDQRFATGAIPFPGVGVLPALGGSILPISNEVESTLKSSQFFLVTAEVGSTMPLFDSGGCF